ncbi:ABC transporter substrate-binding protein [Bosea sp. Root381]|uniref:ABC transporter substrate-binding protein n=1 Tax=Bosea sp. Root381 TaxID=1736524 RepID=UPI0006FCA7B2|nr:ABC transporter substrate-binding protein [Bosea sp. Root381]KRE05861.1 ABC transporter substrate-binding protein [Bosea sp. Root381]
MTGTSLRSMNRRGFLVAGAAAAGTVSMPWVAGAQAKVIKVGLPTILSGRVAQLGTSSRNAALLEVEKVNAAGGLAGRTIELVIRDTKGQPQEAARVARELVNSDGCELLIDAEASTGAFAVHEVARDLGILCVHTNSETSSLSADPKLKLANAFRCARQGIHDSVVGGTYAAEIANAKNLTRWATCSPDYAYGRDTTAEFVMYLKQFAPKVEVISEAWPKIFQPDYTESITKILQAKPQALYSCLWGGDLTSFIDQAAIYALFTQMQFYAVNMADYTALTAVKNLPAGIQSGNRYIKTFPATPENAAWGDAYKAKYGEYPTNWSWQNALAVNFLAEAAKKAGSADGKKIAEALRGLSIKSPFGADGTVTMRAEDQTIVGYAVGWGTTIPKEPYVPEMKSVPWQRIFELEAEWKKSKGFA